MTYREELPNRPPASLARAHAVLIRYPRFNELHEDIGMCQQMSGIAGEPQCMVLEGMTGAGKSTLVRSYAETFMRYETDTGTKIPVFYMETPSPVTVKGMAARMLEVMGDPAAHKGPLWAMNARLTHFIHACEVEIVILDDFHHLIDKETHRVLETVSDWLKVLIKETGVPFLVVGIEGTVELILRANAQLSRLFAVRETLEPFHWNPASEKAIRKFASFVKYAEKGVGIPLSEELPQVELLYRLHCATDGVVGNLMNLMRFAALLAEKQGVEVLTLAILRQAFDKRLRKHMRKEVHPFALDTDVVSPPRSTEVVLSPDSRAQRRRIRDPKVSDVLSAS
jgi:hypothetical protein